VEAPTRKVRPADIPALHDDMSEAVTTHLGLIGDRTDLDRHPGGDKKSGVAAQGSAPTIV
jgi:hypothetical protein